MVASPKGEGTISAGGLPTGSEAETLQTTAAVGNYAFTQLRLRGRPRRSLERDVTMLEGRNSFWEQVISTKGSGGKSKKKVQMKMERKMKTKQRVQMTEKARVEAKERVKAEDRAMLKLEQARWKPQANTPGQLNSRRSRYWGIQILGNT